MLFWCDLFVALALRQFLSVFVGIWKRNVYEPFGHPLSHGPAQIKVYKWTLRNSISLTQDETRKYFRICKLGGMCAQVTQEKKIPELTYMQKE